MGTAPWEDNGAAPTVQQSEPAPWEAASSATPTPPEPDMAPTKSLIKENLTKAGLKHNSVSDEGAASSATSTLPGGLPVTPTPKNPTPEGQEPPKEAKSFLDSVEAGFQMSVTGLIARGRAPDLIEPQDAPAFYRIASQVGMLYGDIPAMLAGAIAGAPVGAAAGTAVAGPFGTVPGAAVGSAAASFAIPAGMRKALMDHYEKGDIKDFGDYWERTSAAFIEAGKAGITGALTSGIGAGVSNMLSPVAIPAAAKTASVLASEIATMVNVGKGLDGQVPSAQDFLDGAIVVGGLHGVMVGSDAMSAKMRDIYAKTGIKPEQVTEHAQIEPTVKQDLLSENVPIPRAYEPMIQGEIPGVLEGEKSSTVAIPKDSPLAEQSPVVGEDSDVRQAAVKMPAEKPPEEPPPENENESEELKAARQSISDSIGEKTERAKEPVTWGRFYENWVDKLDPIKQAVGMLSDPKSLPTTADPYKLARLAADWKGRAILAVTDHTVDFNDPTKTTGVGLKQVLEPVKKDLPNFTNYIVAKRAIDLDARGIETGVDIDAAKKVVEADKGKFEKPAQDLVDYQNRMLKYLKDSGYLSDESFQKMVEMDKNHVPFYRLDPDRLTGGGGKSAANPVKGIKGSELDIANPLYSIAENTSYFIKLAEQNRAKVALADLADTMPDNGVIDRVKTPMKAIQVQAPEIQKMLDEHGIDGDAEALTIFRPAESRLNQNQMVVFRDGQKQIYEAADPSVIRAFDSMNGAPGVQSSFMKLAAAISKTKRAGILLMPDFIVRHNIRNQMVAGTFSEGVTVPFFHMIGNLGEVIGGSSEIYKNWLASGGANTSFTELNKEYIDKNVFGLEKETSFIGHAWNVIKSPVDFLHLSSQLLENATRFTEFKNVAGANPDAERLTTAGYAAREVTPDSTRAGAKEKALGAITAMQNIGIQGADRLARAFTPENAPSTLMKAVAGITMPSALLWLANKDDPRYNDAARWEKDLYWIIPTDHWVDVEDGHDVSAMDPYLLRQGPNGQQQYNDGTVYRIPKPFELGVMFGSMVERTLEAFFTDHPGAFADFQHTLLHGFVPTMVPDVVQPIMEQWANKSMFTGRPVVPERLTKELPDLQYVEYTSNTARALGKMVGFVPGLRDIGPEGAKLEAPMVIENYVRSWTGSAGMYALATADKALEVAGITDPKDHASGTLADIPFVKAFVVRYPSANEQVVQDFLDRAGEHEKYIASKNDLVKRGDPQAAMDLYNANTSQMVSVSGIKSAIFAQQQFIQKVNKLSDIPPDQRRQIIDGAYFRIIQEAKMGVQTLDQTEKVLAGK